MTRAKAAAKPEPEEVEAPAETTPEPEPVAEVPPVELVPTTVLAERTEVHPDANLSTPANAERELEAAEGRGDAATAKAARAALADFERASNSATGKQTRDAETAA